MSFYVWYSYLKSSQVKWMLGEENMEETGTVFIFALRWQGEEKGTDKVDPKAASELMSNIIHSANICWRLMGKEQLHVRLM
jgi:hypothetical protein